MRNKVGQVTIFILVAILIVSAVLVFFLWARPTYFSDAFGDFGFEGCVKDVLEESTLRLGANGGFVNPEFVYNHKGSEFVYLCYTSEYYETCTVQVPFLKNNFDEELERDIRGGIDVCYEESLGDLQDRGYDVVSGNIDYNVEFEPGVIRLEIEAPTSVGSQSFVDFDVEVSSSYYELLMLSTSILQFESVYGDTDLSPYEFLYPDYDIDKLKVSDGTTLYSLSSKGSEEVYSFASRSLAWPAGYDI